ncbi:MAG: glycosyltransferase family 2 protein [Bacillota bacterium]
MNQILLSVIICTYNREDVLGNCLDSLSKQKASGDFYEVIVVDNNSTDRTREVVSTYLDRFDNWRYFFESDQGLSYARNRGCKEARGLYLIYIDDDDILPSEYLENVRQVIERFQPDILGGPVYPYYTSKKPRWFKDYYAIRKNEEQSCFSTRCRITGCNFIIRKALLENLGMFDVDLGMKGNKLGLGEEALVLDTYRRKTPAGEQRVYYALECYVLHHVPDYKMKLSYVLARQYCGGKMTMRLRPKSVLQVILELPLRTMWYIIGGVARRDCVGILRNIVFQLGLVAGAFSKSKDK